MAIINITANGIPDGTFSTTLSSADTTQVFGGDVAFLGGVAAINTQIADGYYYGLVRDNNVPSTMCAPIKTLVINETGTQVFIVLNKADNAHYLMSADWAPTDTYALRAKFVTSTDQTAIIVGSMDTSNTYFGLGTNDRLYLRIDGVNFVATVVYDDGKQHTAYAEISPSNVKLFFDGDVVLDVARGSSETMILNSIGANILTGPEFQGIVSDVSLIDITNPANSLYFQLSNLTGDSEVDNGVTLSYQNIALTQAVRDTFTTIAGQISWVGGLTSFDRATEFSGYDVILLVGQSNMQGVSTPIDVVLDATDPRIMQYGSTSQAVTIAADPLDNLAVTADSIGLGLSLAKSYLSTIPASRRVMLVPAAKGGTGFGTGFWRSGGIGYTNAVSTTNAAIGYGGLENTIIAMAWHQGESDAAMTELQYSTDLDLLINGVRSEIVGASSVTPFIVGEVPTWSTLYGAGVAAALADTPSRVANTAWVATSDLTDKGDSVHFDTASLRTLGGRYASKL